MARHWAVFALALAAVGLGLAARRTAPSTAAVGAVSASPTVGDSRREAAPSSARFGTLPALFGTFRIGASGPRTTTMAGQAGPHELDRVPFAGGVFPGAQGPCRGFGRAAPYHRIVLEAAVPGLRFQVESDARTTLVVGTQGDYVCSGDAPLEFLNPTPQTYEVWIGTLDGVAAVPATLRITVLEPRRRDPDDTHLETRGPIDRQALRAVLRRHRRETDACYARTREPTAPARRVVVTLIVGEGAATSAEVVASSADDETSACLRSATLRWRYPEHTDLSLLVVPIDERVAPRRT